MRPHLASLVEDMRRWNGEVAVVELRGNRHVRTSYGDLATLAGRFAAELCAQGIAPGERVVLWGESSANWIAAFFGCLLRGVLAVPLDAAGSAEFAQRVLNDVSPKLVVGGAEQLRSIELQVPILRLDRLASEIARGPDFSVDASVGLDTPFQIVFTSGTTSGPKGVVHTHRNVLASVEPIEREIAKYRRYGRLVHPLRFLHTLPLSHVFGQFMGLWIPTVLGAELHLAPKVEPARMADEIHRQRIHVLIAVPRVLDLLRAHLVARRPELIEEMLRAQGQPVWRRWWILRRVHRMLGWRFWALISGGATLPLALEQFWNVLGLAVIQGYGMTETAALVTLNHPFRIGKGTLGKPLPGREVKLSPEGEVLVRGEMISGATWQHGAIHEREGEWLATGDLAQQEASGELRFLGRKGDVIVTAAGMNVYPADIEQALKSQPGVRDTAVAGCEGVNGQEVAAALLFGGSDGELNEVVRKANATLADFQQVRRYFRWPEETLPYTPTGKLIRRRVAAWVCGQMSAKGSGETAGETKDGLLALLAEVTGEHIAASDDTRLNEDLHLDSLGRVQLQSLMESHWSVEVSDEQIAQIETLGDLRRLVGGASAAATEEKPQAGEIGSVPVEGDDEAGMSNVEQSASSSTSALAKAERRVAKRPMELPYPRWPWRWPMQWARVLFQELIARPLVWLLGAPKVERTPGVIPPGPLLLIANHVTAYDGALVLYALPYRLRRRVAIAMSGELLLDLRRGRGQGNAVLNALAPFGYWLITALYNVFPLPRLQGFRRSFAHAGDALDHGYSVLVFPEGHRSETGTLQPFRQGIGLLAKESQVPVLPMMLYGLGELRASGNSLGWLRSGRLKVRVGSAVQLGEDASPQQWTEALERRMEEMVSAR